MAVTHKGVPMMRQGDQVIGFMNSTQVKSIQGYQDMSSLASWYRQDPLANHLGLVQFWGNQDRTSVPIYGELLRDKAIIEVPGFDGSFSYDIPIEEAKGCVTEKDMSNQQFPGIDGSAFKIALDREYTKGDILAYDPEFGEQIIVTDDEEVKMDGTAFVHTVKLLTNDKYRSFPAHQLAKGISYIKLTHAGGEYTTEFSSVEFPDTVGHMTCEFKLGGIRGAEAYVTGFADKRTKGFSGAAASSKQYMDKLQAEAEAKGEFVFVTDWNNKTNKPNMKNASIGTTMEYLVMKELEKMTAQSLLFQKAGTVTDANGTFRINEGLWHQLRRGKRILYGRPGGITRKTISDAAEYVFRANPDLDYSQRRIKFKCGSRAYENVLDLFKDEVNAQLDRLSKYLGTDNQLPGKVIVGNDLENLKLKQVRFTEVFLPGIGYVELEKDESLDHGLGDRFSRGMHGDGYAHTTYSMVIWDVSSQSYSNNQNLPKGTKLVDNGKSDSNIFIVKPEGEMTYWGRENGRYDISKAGDIVSSSKYIGSSFWAFNSNAVWVRDLTKFVMIELNPAARKGFN